MLDFTGVGIKCPCCSKSKKIYRHKYSFKHQHCNTKKHQQFLKSYKDTEENEETNVFSDSLLREQLQKQLKENRAYKIQVRQKEEAFQLEKQRNKTQKKQFRDRLKQHNP